MTTIWIDVLTPKQALFFWPLVESLERRGLKTLVTARRYEQLDWILRVLELDALVIGRFGGESLREKLESSTERQMLLLKHLKKERPDVAISSGSVETTRICFGLQVPHLLASDSPHSPVNRMCVPLSYKILTPFVIGLRDWAVWGARRQDILRYRALDPVAWIRRYDRLEDRAPEPPGDEYALVRIPEYKASYILGRGMAEALEVVRRVSELFDEVVVLCRYRGEAQLFRNKVPRNVRLLSKPVLALPFIRNASIVFSGGGTIAQEAALLGKPTVLFYPGETPAVHRFLQSKGLLTVLRPRDYGKIRKISEHLTGSSVRRAIRQRAEKLNKMLEDPAEFIEKTVLSLLH